MLSKRLFAFVASLLLVVGVASGAAQAQENTVADLLPGDPIPTDPSVVSGTLENGLRYIIQENSQPENRALLRLVVNAGSILEDEDQQGLAHFVEHMAFNGTTNFEKQELVDFLESVGMQFGAHVNAYTSFDETVYMLQLPMDDAEVLETGFQILADWAQGVSFDPEEVDKERGVVIEEWRGRRGAQARIQDEQFPILFEGSRYAERLPIGKTEILETAPVEALRRFYDDWYRPNLMGVAIVGDFDATEMESKVQQYFGGLTTPAESRERIAYSMPVDLPPRVTVATDAEFPQSVVFVLYKQTPAPNSTVADYRRGLVGSLYSGMLNARLVEVQQQADAPFLFSASGLGSFSRGVDVYQMFALVTEDKVAIGLEALLTEAERVSKHGFTASEFERQKVEMRRNYERRVAEKENQESGALISSYVQYLLEGDPYLSVETELALVDRFLPEITLEETNILASEWIREEGRILMVQGPEKEGLIMPSEETLTGLFATVAGKEIAPYEDEIVDAPLLPELPTGSAVVMEEHNPEVDVSVWTLENGVRVVLKPTDFKDDEVRFSATSPGGSSLVTADDEYDKIRAASTVVQEGGVGVFDQIALEKKLAGQAVNVSASIGELSEGIRGSASPQDLETAFQLIYLRFTAPRKDEEAFAAFKSLQAGFLGNAANDPNFVFSDTINSTMSQGHPRRPSPSIELTEQMDLDASLAFYQERFADASDFTFYFTGAFEPEEIRPLVEQYLGGLPNLGREEEWRDIGVDPPTGVIEKVVRKGVEPQSRTMLIFAGEAEYSLEESMAISALADVLDIRLRELLREDLGGTYGVGVSGVLSERPDHEYDMTITFGSAPERAEELTAVALEEIERIKAEGPDAETVAKVRETQRRNKETNLRENSYWLSRLMTFDRQGREFHLIPSYDRIEGWTAAQVQAAAVRYLRTDQYAKFVLYPEGFIP